MLTLLGSLLGFVTSTGPGIFKEIMSARQDAKDKEHELKLMAQQSQDRRDEAVITSAGEANVAVQESVQETTKRASLWVVNLSGSVRPVVTYSFFAEFVLLTALRAFDAIDDATYSMIWSENTEAIFATILAFWFGQRLTSKWVR
jgi:hypothetical protein